MDAVGRRAEVALTFCGLVAAIAIGAYLRFAALGEPSYWLDEVLDAHFSRDALTHPWWHWITGFGREHGPLHFAIQVLTHDEFTGRLPAALCGLATIVAIFFVCGAADPATLAEAPPSRRRHTAAVAALLLAASPFHVYYSREARPYALLMLLAVLLLIAVLRDKIVFAAIVAVIALYTSAIAAAMVVSAGVAALLLRRFRLAGVLLAVA